MRHIVYSLAFALGVNGASTSATVNTPQMTPAAPTGGAGLSSTNTLGGGNAAASQTNAGAQAGGLDATANLNANAGAGDQRSLNLPGSNVNTNPNGAGDQRSLNLPGSNVNTNPNGAGDQRSLNLPGSNPNANPNVLPGNIVGYLNGGWIRNWNTVLTGAWRGNLVGYWNGNLNLVAPLNVWAPANLATWNLGLPINRYGPSWGSGTPIYPALSTQSWWSTGQRFSWSFLPLKADSSFTFTEEMRTCVLKEIEDRVHQYDSSIAPGWLVPTNGATQLATDIAYGAAPTGANWLSWVIPFGAPNSAISSSNFVTPFVNILKSPQFYSDIENDCHIPASNFTVLNKQIKFQDNSWAATTTSGAGVDITDPVVGSAPSSFSPFQLAALPFLSLAALIRRD